MSNEIVPFDKQMTWATAFAESRMFGIATVQQAISLMALCECEGIHPAAAIRDYHIIEGRPSLKSEAMLSRFQAAGGKVQWLAYTDEVVEAKFSHPQGGELTISWDMARAKQAGLGPGKTSGGKDNMWAKFPRNMLKARVISEGIRTLYPGVLSGCYSPEEVSDFNAPPIMLNPEPVAPPVATPEAVEAEVIHADEQPDDLITAVTELAELMKIPPSECLTRLTNTKYTSMHQVRTMPPAHRKKLAVKCGEEKEALKLQGA